MSRDLITRPYGRFYYLPREMVRRGHQVRVFLLSYANDPPSKMERDSVGWISRSLRQGGPAGYCRQAERLVRRFRPDWIVGFSDTYYGIAATTLARRYHIRSAIDAYDNYESYLSWCRPLHWLWHRAIAAATVVTTAGPHLGRYMGRFRAGADYHLVPMAPDPTGFVPLPADECRVKLSLPRTEKLVGYCGSLHHSRGVEVLFQAFQHLQRSRSDVRLVIAGRRQRGMSIPPGALWLGYLDDSVVPVLLNALNVVLVVNRLSSFGNFSYPVKLYEAMACRIPVVASATEPACWILQDHPHLLCEPGNPHDMAAKIEQALVYDRYDYGRLNTWGDSAERFETALRVNH